MPIFGHSDWHKKWQVCVYDLPGDFLSASLAGYENRFLRNTCVEGPTVFLTTSNLCHSKKFKSLS